jgi:hypothetical protein
MTKYLQVLYVAWMTVVITERIQSKICSKCLDTFYIIGF